MHCMHIPDQLLTRVPSMNQVNGSNLKMFSIRNVAEHIRELYIVHPLNTTSHYTQLSYSSLQNREMRNVLRAVFFYFSESSPSRVEI